jgi:hypothetical protein
MEFAVRYGKLPIGYSAILSVTLTLAVDRKSSTPLEALGRHIHTHPALIVHTPLEGCHIYSLPYTPFTTHSLFFFPSLNAAFLLLKTLVLFPVSALV